MKKCILLSIVLMFTAGCMRGFTGNIGPQGEKGPQGEQGPSGRDGDSCELSAVMIESKSSKSKCWLVAQCGNADPIALQRLDKKECEQDVE